MADEKPKWKRYRTKTRTRFTLKDVSILAGVEVVADFRIDEDGQPEEMGWCRVQTPVKGSPIRFRCSLDKLGGPDGKLTKPTLVVDGSGV